MPFHVVSSSDSFTMVIYSYLSDIEKYLNIDIFVSITMSEGFQIPISFFVDNHRMRNLQAVYVDRANNFKNQKDLSEELFMLIGNTVSLAKKSVLNIFPSSRTDTMSDIYTRFDTKSKWNDSATDHHCIYITTEIYFAHSIVAITTDQPEGLQPCIFGFVEKDHSLLIQHVPNAV